MSVLEVHACEDCCDVHGDTEASWLAKWPVGAEFWKDHNAWLCDGCAEERRDTAMQAVEDEHTLRTFYARGEWPSGR